MYLTGFADEAADGIDGQIDVIRSLGWRHLEIRAVDGKNIHDVTDREFAEIREKLEKEGIRAGALGSNIANWGRDITEPFPEVLETLKRTIARCRELNCTLVRIMSWKVIRDGNGRAAADQQADERFRRLREITGRFLDNGITPVHENCATFGGMSWGNTLRMLEEVPGLKLVFDTGNPPLTEDFTSPWPYTAQSAREFYEHVKDHIAHVHIKDSRRDPVSGVEVYHWPGEGDGDVRFILEDLSRQAYDGGLSIEPHMAVVYHDAGVQAPQEARKANFIDYGRRLEAMLDDLGISRGTPSSQT